MEIVERPHFLEGSGELTTLFRELDWTKTAIGAAASWPQSLKTAIGILLKSQLPMFIAWGPKRIFLYNDAYAPILGNKHPAALGSEFPAIWSEIWTEIEPLVLAVDRGESVFHEDLKFLMNRKGYDEETHFTFSYSPLHGERDEVVGLFCACVETSERKKTEESERRLVRGLKEAERAREELFSFFMQVPAPMVILNGPDHVFMLANALYETYVGRKVVGKTVREAFTEEEVGYYISVLDRVYQTGEPYVGRNLPLALPNADGVPVPTRIDVSYTPFRDEDGNVKGIIGFLQDVTEEYNARANMRKYTEELKAAKEEAERANALKSAFLANMSHEIRTPLGAMIGFADLLREPGLSEQERLGYIDILSRNGESLSVIINDILDLSKVEAGHLTLEFTEAVPEQIAEDVISLLRVKANEKDLILKYEPAPSTPKTVASDPMRIRQILLNLVGNAIKFTSTGSVVLRSSGYEMTGGRAGVCFEIIDTGIGIPAEQRDNVFKMFVQADGSTTRRFGGTGLGLALSRSLSRSLGGDVSISQSEVGSGTTFLVVIADLPERRMAAAASAREERKPAVDLATKSLVGVKVLVVDDAPENQHLIWAYLHKQGATVDTAGNGLEGYKKALAGKYDVVLMDIQMPEMDGYTATQKLRTAGYRKPIIALTAHAMTEVRNKVLQMGANAHLAKPINFKELITTIVHEIH